VTTGNIHNERRCLAAPADTAAQPRVTGPPAGSLTAMLEARSVALVGASQRSGSLGAQMVAEAAASRSRPRLYPVNPRYREVGGLPCHPGLAALPEPPDLVLLAVPDSALEQQLATAAALGCQSAVIFGGAHEGPGREPGLRSRLANIARSAGMALCGAGCMGFVNEARGLRAIGYAEPDPVPAGPVALVTHSGSVFSTLLYSRRGFGFTIAVSSGQELVTTAAEYAGYALALPETRVLALVLEAIRDAPRLRAVLAGAAEADVPVVLFAAGDSDAGRDLVTAHSGALAAGDGAWSALADAYGVHRVGDLAELADTLELFTPGRRAAPPGPRPAPAPRPMAGQAAAPSPPGGPADVARPGPTAGYGLATVHDSGLERAHVADLAQQLGVPFAAIGEPTTSRLRAVLDPGLEPGNPLDIWGTGRDPERQLTEALAALADDPAVGAVAFAVDLVPEEDESYPRAMLAVAARTGKPLAVLAGLPSTIDRDTAARLREAGIPVLEGTRSGLLALRHLLTHTSRLPSTASSPAAPRGSVVVVAAPTQERGGCDNAHKPPPPRERDGRAADGGSPPTAGNLDGAAAGNLDGAAAGNLDGAAAEN
jgi:acetate---CoA ligase (ADP-forming)